MYHTEMAKYSCNSLGNDQIWNTVHRQNKAGKAMLCIEVEYNKAIGGVDLIVVKLYYIAVFVWHRYTE